MIVTVAHLIALVFAFVFFVIAGWQQPLPNRLTCWGLALWVLTVIFSVSPALVK